MRSPALRVVWAVAAAVLVATGSIPRPAAAAETEQTVLALPRERPFTPSVVWGDTLELRSTPSANEWRFVSGSGDSRVGLFVAPPTGEQLVVGRTYATSTGTGAPGTARLVPDTTLPCVSPHSTTVGSMTVRDVQLDGSGELRSLALDLALLCDDGAVRDGVLRWRSNAAFALATFDHERPPAAVAGTDARTSVTMQNAGTVPLALGAAGIRSHGYPDVGTSELVTDGCSGTTVAPGATCVLGVRWRSAVEGRAGAEVVVQDELGRDRWTAELLMAFEPAPVRPTLRLQPTRGAVFISAEPARQVRQFERTCPGTEPVLIGPVGAGASHLDEAVPTGAVCSYRARSYSGGEYSQWSASSRSGPLPQPEGNAGLFTPLEPSRVVDTRNGTGVARGAVGPGRTTTFAVLGRGGVPASGVHAVVLNVTGVRPTSSTWLSAFPGGTTRPASSNLNLATGQVRANQVVVAPGADGTVSLFNATGSVDLVVDVQGFYASASGPDGDGFNGVTPVRLLDTRTADDAYLAGERTVLLEVPWWVGHHVTAADVVVTVTGSGGGGHVTVWPGDGDVPPLASNTNFADGQTVAGHAVVPVVEEGGVRYFAVTRSGGMPHLLVDLTGVYGAPMYGEWQRFQVVAPQRLIDTRRALGPLGMGVDLDVPQDGVAVALGVVTNTTATLPVSNGYLQVWAGPSESSAYRPTTSNVNFVPGETASTLSVTATRSGGASSTVSHYGRSSHLLVDLLGYFY